MSERRDHHPCGPSSAWRVEHCPGSAALAEQAREDGLSVAGLEAAADYGMAVHAALAKLARGERLEQDGEVERAARRGWEIATERLGILPDAPPGPTSWVRLVEERVGASDFFGTEMAFGTLDLAERRGSHRVGTVIDWKSGAWPDSTTKEEAQIRDYLAMYWGRDRIDQPVRGHVVWIETAQVLTVDYTPEQCQKRLDEIVLRSLAAQRPDAPRTTGPWCRYCPAVALCPEARGAQRELQAADDVESLPPQRVSELLDLWKDIVRPLGESLEKHAKALLAADRDAVPGYRLIEQERRSAPVAELVECLAAAGVDRGELEALVKRTLSVADAERLWTRSTASGTGSAKSKYREFMDLTKDVVKTRPVPVMRRVAK